MAKRKPKHRLTIDSYLTFTIPVRRNIQKEMDWIKENHHNLYEKMIILLAEELIHIQDFLMEELLKIVDTYLEANIEKKEDVETKTAEDCNVDTSVYIDDEDQSIINKVVFISMVLAKYDASEQYEKKMIQRFWSFCKRNKLDKWLKKVEGMIIGKYSQKASDTRFWAMAELQGDDPAIWMADVMTLVRNNIFKVNYQNSGVYYQMLIRHNYNYAVKRNYKDKFGTQVNDLIVKVGEERAFLVEAGVREILVAEAENIDYKESDAITIIDKGRYEYIARHAVSFVLSNYFNISTTYLSKTISTKRFSLLSRYIAYHHVKDNEEFRTLIAKGYSEPTAVRKTVSKNRNSNENDFVNHFLLHTDISKKSVEQFLYSFGS